MVMMEFPIIDQVATGKNILALRKEKGLTVRDMQEFFGFEEPQAIYRWQYGKTLPSVDNLYALSALLDVPMERILVPVSNENIIHIEKQQDKPAAFDFFMNLVEEEVRVYKADFFFCFRFFHHKNTVCLFFVCTYSCVLCFNQKIQITRKSENATLML